jgi:hypothetical protein
MDCALTIISTGRSAQNLRELRDHLASVPAPSLSHHFYESLLRPAFDDPEFRNDFALWARDQLNDAALAERLAVIDPLEFPDLEDLRQMLLDVVEDHLAETSEVPQARRGREFHFLRSQFVIFTTGFQAQTPAELAQLLPQLSTGSIFYHFVEARRRLPLLLDDFSVWLATWGPSYDSLRADLSNVDFQLWTLNEIKERIARCFAAAGLGPSPDTEQEP